MKNEHKLEKFLENFNQIAISLEERIKRKN